MSHLTSPFSCMVAGLGTALEGVSEFVQWRHPEVTLKELQAPAGGSQRFLQPPAAEATTVQQQPSNWAAKQSRAAVTAANSEEAGKGAACYEDDLLQVCWCIHCACKCLVACMRCGFETKWHELAIHLITVTLHLVLFQKLSLSCVQTRTNTTTS